MRTSRTGMREILQGLKHGDTVKAMLNGETMDCSVDTERYKDEGYIVLGQDKIDGTNEGDLFGNRYGWAVRIGDPHSDIQGLELIKGPVKKSDGTLNLKELDKLVINQEAREEIESVIKQQKFGNKIFEEWGLGETIEYGKGMTMLFHGAPGTGKTHGGICIAKCLGKELLVITPSQIQSSEPGGANRAIEAAFAEATTNDKVLFFDECDGLICKRENVGMIIGSEINTLLTSIEKFEGVCILCTNMIGNLDEALERRLSLIQEFPKPDRPTREIIWGKMIPSKMPVEDGVTAAWLSKSKLTGGQIKNVLLSAARRAVSDNSGCVTKEHFEKAIDKIKLSSGKMGKTHNPWADAGPESGAGTSSRSRAVGVGKDKVKDDKVMTEIDISTDKQQD